MIINRSKILALALASVVSTTFMFCSEDDSIRKTSPPGKGKTKTTTGTTTGTTTDPGTSTDSTATVTKADITYEETFEGSDPFSTAHSKDVGDWDYALQFVTNPVFKGQKASRFEIRDDQPLVSDGFRSEVVIVKGADGEIGKETWYSFAVYFPSDGYEYDDEREVINQWYQDGSPATSIRTEQDKIYLESGNDPDARQTYPIASIEKNKWHTFEIHIVHSYYSDGLIELWYDGVKKISHSGGNMYNDVLPKWKVGLYKSAFKYGTSDVHKRVILFDNIRVGNSQATYTEMNPANN